MLNIFSNRNHLTIWKLDEMAQSQVKRKMCTKYSLNDGRIGEEGGFGKSRESEMERKNEDDEGDL